MRAADGYAGNVVATARSGHAWLVPLGLWISLTVSCLILSGSKTFWNDELFSYYLVSDPSFRGMLAAFADKINNSPIVYFVTGWLWAQAFGASELSLRLFSSFGVSAAALLTWVMLRRQYGSWPASLATVCVFGFSILILLQNVEARMYGLYLALAALAIIQFDRLQRDQTCSTAAAVAIACTHAALLHTHLYGIFYSATIVAGGVLVDWCRGRWQPRVYFAVSAAWLSLLAYIPTFLVQADAGRPRTWIPPPTIGDLAYFYTFELRYVSVVLVALASVYLWRRYRHRSAFARPHLDRATVRSLLVTRPTLALACLILLVPIGVWLVSLTVKPIFYNRYMLPSLLGAAVVIAHLLAAFDTAIRRRDAAGTRQARGPLASVSRLYRMPVLRAATLAFLLAGPAAGPLLFPPSWGWSSISDYDQGHAELPIVVQFSNTFLRHLHYAPRPDRYVYLLDWETAAAPESGTFPPQEYKHMEALLRQYPERFAGQIVSSETFVAEHDRFLVIDYAVYDYPCDHGSPWYSLERNLDRWDERLQCPRWLEERILPDARYQVRELAHLVDGSWVMLLVERTGP